MNKKNLLLAAAMLLPGAAAHADEGMWTLYNLPQAVYEQMKSYGFSAMKSSTVAASSPQFTKIASTPS